MLPNIKQRELIPEAPANMSIPLVILGLGSIFIG
jgi:hypothetical protein